MINKRYNLTDLADNIVIVQEVINMYVDDKMSIAQISMAKGLSIHIITLMLKENNIEMRSKK